ncbi:hypothetical protein CIHG_07761 [Coccidioides immitis H538.4]|uniref:Uncharacterized protein n=1 Tax=Coccidioides immitis H538.4 TaxID=396776 RepID=A0A0J8UQC5_COCIT|nr:hypothetical protein CIHG_07761 [Coccidioides immitis H538.4]
MIRRIQAESRADDDKPYDITGFTHPKLAKSQFGESLWAESGVWIACPSAERLQARSSFFSQLTFSLARRATAYGVRQLMQKKTVCQPSSIIASNVRKSRVTCLSKIVDKQMRVRRPEIV